MPADPGGGRLDLAVGTLLAAAVLGLSWLLSGVAGSAGLPRTDDWAFARVALELHRSGTFHLVGWGEMTLVALAIWAQPWLWAFGDHQWALDLAAGMLVGVGLAASYLLARRALTRAGAVLVVASVAVFPGFVRDASSFMTDGPAFGVQVLCLLVGVAALGRFGRSRAALSWLAVAIGVFGFGIRELAVAAPLAVLAAEAGTEGRRAGSLAARAGVLGAACGAVWFWHRGLSGTQPWFGHPALLAGAAYVVAAGITAALGLLPALAWSAPRWWHTPRPRARAGAMAGGLVLCAVLPWYAHDVHIGTVWFVGDYLGRFGMNGDKLLMGLRPSVVPEPLWTLLEVVAVGAFVLVCGLLGEAAATRVRPGRGEADGAHRARHGGAADARAVALRALRWFTAFSVAGLFAADAFNGVLFDRYLWPLVFAGGVLLVALQHAPAEGRTRSRAPDAHGVASAGRTTSPVRVSRVVAGALLAGIGVLGLALAADSDAFDAARWRAGTQLVDAGIPAERVDAGFEWVGAHTDLTADVHRAVVSSGMSWWVSMFGLPMSCAVVAASPAAPRGYVEAARLAWHPELAWGTSHLVVYRLPGCR
jgi:hypothetical protein